MYEKQISDHHLRGQYSTLADMFIRFTDNVKPDWCTPQEQLVAVKPRRPPMTNLGTETAFRHDHCKHFQKK